MTNDVKVYRGGKFMTQEEADRYDKSAKQSAFDNDSDAEWEKYFNDSPPPYRGSYPKAHQGYYKPYTEDEKKPKLLYFAYGSNLNVPQMRGRCPDSQAVSVCRLFEWRLEFRGVADVVSMPGEFVEGALYRISKRDEDALDRYESFPSLYSKRYFTVKFKGGKSEQAMMYVMNAGTIHRPSKGYFDCIADGFNQWTLDPVTLYEALQRAAWTERGVKDRDRKVATRFRGGAMGLPVSPKEAARIIRSVGSKYVKSQTYMAEDYFGG